MALRQGFGLLAKVNRKPTDREDVPRRQNLAKAKFLAVRQGFGLLAEVNRRPTDHRRRDAAPDERQRNLAVRQGFEPWVQL